MIVLTFILVFLWLALEAYLVWAMQQKLEKMANQLMDLTSKVKAMEEVVAENFETVEKRFAKIDHEIKEVTSRAEFKAKEAIKATRRFERVRADE